MEKPKFRHELKFVVDVHEGERFREEISPFCEKDPHSGPDGAYEVVSLYYDTADLRFFRDREESVGYRRKLRLRTYIGGSAPKTLFLEVKEKHKHLVSKKKCDLTDLSLLSDSVDLFSLGLDPVLALAAEVPARKDIEYLHQRLGLHPVVIVRYVRAALAAKDDVGLRITLDKRLTGGGRNFSRYDPKEEPFILPPNQGVLEIKSFSTIPHWLISALRRYGFRRGRYSKYSEAVSNTASGREYFVKAMQLSNIPNSTNRTDSGSFRKE